MNKWISVEEREPANDVYVLVAKYDHRPKVEMHFIQIAARMNNRWVDDHNGEVLEPKYGYVTHWMPLPDAPVGDNIDKSPAQKWIEFEKMSMPERINLINSMN